MKTLFHSYFQFAISLTIRNSERWTNLIEIFTHLCSVKPAVELKMFREFREGILHLLLFSSLSKEVSCFQSIQLTKYFLTFQRFQRAASFFCLTPNHSNSQQQIREMSFYHRGKQNDSSTGSVLHNNHAAKRRKHSRENIFCELKVLWRRNQSLQKKDIFTRTYRL